MIIEAHGLTKRFRHAVKDPGLGGAVKHLIRQRYREQTAVDAIDLTVDAGEAVAYVGPNGAGKSTTIKMLTGILTPSDGDLRVLGLVPHLQRIDNGRNIGVVFGQRTQLWWDIAVRESFGLLRDIYAIPEPRFRENLDRFIELLGLSDFLGQPVRKLSLGQRVRAEIAAALLHDPAIVYLDEPTIGLDIDVREKIRAFIRELNAEQGTTVMLTSHDLGDIEGICQRIVVIDGGRIVYDGGLETLKDEYARERAIHVQLREPFADPQALASDVAPGTLAVGDDGRHLTVRYDRFEVNGGQLVQAIMGSAEVVDLSIEEPSVEQVIRRVYARQLSFDTLGGSNTADAGSRDGAAAGAEAAGAAPSDALPRRR